MEHSHENLVHFILWLAGIVRPLHGDMYAYERSVKLQTIVAIDVHSGRAMGFIQIVNGGTCTHERSHIEKEK